MTFSFRKFGEQWVRRRGVYECDEFSAGGWRRLKTHRRTFQGTMNLYESLMNSPSPGDLGSDLPNLADSESGSSYRWSIPPTEVSMPQTEAAPLTQVETSLIDGREVRLVCQQSSSSLQTSSERPSLGAFDGLEGFSPAKAPKTAPDPENPPNGSVPVRTYKVRINTRAHWAPRGTYLVYHHSHCVYIRFLRRRALLQSEPRWKKVLWCHERSGPPVYCGLRQLYPEAWITHNCRKLEVREACGDGVGIRNQNVSLNNHMRLARGMLVKRLTPFKSPCTISTL